MPLNYVLNGCWFEVRNDICTKIIIDSNNLQLANRM